MEIFRGWIRKKNRLYLIWLLFLPVIILSVPLLVVSQSAAPPNPFSSAIALIKKGDYAAAIPLLEPLSGDTATPSQAGRAHFLIGYCQHNLNNHAAAREHYQKVAAGQPLLKHYAGYYLGRSYRDTGETSRALETFSALVQANPLGSIKARGLMQLIHCYEATANAQGVLTALDELKRAPAVDERWVTERIYLRGWALHELGRIKESAAELKKLYLEYPTTAYCAKAWKLLNSDQRYIPEGLTEPVTQEEKLDRIDKLTDKDSAGQALTELEPLIKAAEASGKNSYLHRMYQLQGMAYYNLRKSAEALDSFQKAQSLRTERDLTIDYYTAMSLARLDKDAEAIDLFKSIYTDHPESSWAPHALERTARLCQLLRRDDEALEAYNRLARDYPGHEKTAECMYSIAWVNYLRGEYQQALDYFQKVPTLKDDPTLSAKSRYWTARTYEKLGHPEQALALDQEILRNYWKTGYSFLLVHYLDRQDIKSDRNPPVLPESSLKPPWPQLILARELAAIGMSDDADEELNMAENEIGHDHFYALEISRLHLSMGNYYRSQSLVYNNFTRDLYCLPGAEPELFRLTYPLAYPEFVSQGTKQYHLDPFLVLSVMRAESTYRPVISSSAGAIGLMQIMPGTGRQIAKELGELGDYNTELLEGPELNIRFGCYYLRKVMDNAPSGGEEAGINRWIDALASYNAGEANLRKWRKRFPNARPDEFIEQIPFNETRNYVARILGFYHIYERAYPAGFMAP